MKKLLLILLCFPLLFSSCKKEDEELAVAPLIGLWDLETVESANGDIFLINGAGNYQLHFFETGYIHYLKNDSTYEIAQYTYTNTQFTTINEAPLTPNGSQGYPVTYHISQTTNLLTLFYDIGDEFVGTIFTYSKH